jgi:hypothetical protein
VTHATAADVLDDTVTRAYWTSKPGSRGQLLGSFGIEECVVALDLDSCAHDQRHPFKSKLESVARHFAAFLPHGCTARAKA